MTPADLAWRHASDRVLTMDGSAGEWTLALLPAEPPNRHGFGPGWYLYGPDLSALPLGNKSKADALAAARPQVHAYLTVERVRLESQGTGPVVPDEVRAAIHAGHVGQVGIFCDRCGRTFEGDFLGETREDRFAAARRHLEVRHGWRCGDEDLCVVCVAAGA